MSSLKIDPQPLTAKPRIRLRPVLFLLACGLVLGLASYFRPEPYRALYGSLAGLLIFALVYQYRKETSLVRNHLSAVAVVTDYVVRGKHAPYFGGGVPIIKYEFVAFNQKTYQGETGHGARSLQKGSQITILYNPENPTVSHPLGGFVFYSFR
ncbi:MAG: DUF3592 domain-containing protein [Terriglobales bacterium]